MPRKSLKKPTKPNPPQVVFMPLSKAEKPVVNAVDGLIKKIFEIKNLGITEPVQKEFAVQYKAALQQPSFLRELERQAQSHLNSHHELQNKFHLFSVDEKITYIQKSNSIINLFYLMLTFFEKNDKVSKKSYENILYTLWANLNAEHAKLHQLIILKNEYFSTHFEFYKSMLYDIEPKFRTLLAFAREWDRNPDDFSSPKAIIYAATPPEAKKFYTSIQDELFKWHRCFVIVEYYNCTKAMLDSNYELAIQTHEKANALLTYLKDNQGFFLKLRKLPHQHYNIIEADQIYQIEELETQLKRTSPNTALCTPSSNAIQQESSGSSELAGAFPDYIFSHLDIFAIDAIETRAKDILEKACLIKASKSLTPDASQLIADHQEAINSNPFAELIIAIIIEKSKNTSELFEQYFDDKKIDEIEKIKEEIQAYHSSVINVLHFLYFHLLNNPILKAKSHDALVLYWEHLTICFKKMHDLYVNNQLSIGEIGSYYDKIHQHYVLIEDCQKILIKPDSPFFFHVTSVEAQLLYSHFLLLHPKDQYILKASDYESLGRKSIELLEENLSLEKNAQQQITALKKQLSIIEEEKQRLPSVLKQFFVPVYEFTSRFDHFLNLARNFTSDPHPLFEINHVSIASYELTIAKITRNLNKMKDSADMQATLLIPTFDLTCCLLEKIHSFSAFTLPSFLDETCTLCQRWSEIFYSQPESLNRQIILSLFKTIENKLASLRAIVAEKPSLNVTLEQTVDNICFSDLNPIFVKNIKFLHEMLDEFTETKAILLGEKESERERRPSSTLETQFNELSEQVKAFKARPIIDRFEPFPIAALEQTKSLLLALRQLPVRSSQLRAAMQLLLNWIQFTTVEEKYSNDSLKKITNHFRSLFNLCHECFSALSRSETVEKLIRDTQSQKIKEKRNEKKKEEKKKERKERKEKQEEQKISSSYQLPRSNTVPYYPVSAQELPNLQPWITVGKKKTRKSSSDLQKERNIPKEIIPWCFKPVIFKKKATPYQNRKDEVVKTESAVSTLVSSLQKLVVTPLEKPTPSIQKDKPESSPILIVEQDAMDIDTLVVPDNVKEKMNKIEEAGYSVFIGGGWVRFMVAPEESREPLPPHDLDLTTNAPITVIEKLFPHEGTIREITVNKTRMFIFAFYDKIVQIFCSNAKTLKEEASRRDITRNALFCDSKGKVINVENYAATFASSYLIPIGDARKRIPEDYSLILRYLRLKNQCSLFLDPSLSEVIREFAPELHANISWGVLMSNLIALFMRFEPFAYLNLNDLWDFNVIAYLYGNHEAFIENTMYYFWHAKIHEFYHRRQNEPKRRDDVYEIASWFLLPLALSNTKYQNTDDAISATVNEIQQKFAFKSKISMSLQHYLKNILPEYDSFCFQSMAFYNEYSVAYTEVTDEYDHQPSSAKMITPQYQYQYQSKLSPQESSSSSQHQTSADKLKHQT